MRAKILLILIGVLIMTKLISQPKSAVGVSINEFKKKFPQMNTQQYEDEVTFSDKEKVAGLDASWSYRFKQGVLEWIFLHKYIDKVNKGNFDKSLVWTKKIIADFIKIYGDPDKIEYGNTNFIDPYEKKHWGYDVIRAVWLNAEKMKIKVRFTFKGGKGEYSFLISIDFHEKNYSF